MPLDGFPDFNKMQEEFEGSSMFRLYYRNFLRAMHTHPCEAPVKSKVIERALGIAGPAVRSLVRHARLNGELVCSYGKGYYYAKTPEEAQVTINHLRNRANIELRCADKMAASISRLQQQKLEVA